MRVKPYPIDPVLIACAGTQWNQKSLPACYWYGSRNRALTVTVAENAVSTVSEMAAEAVRRDHICRELMTKRSDYKPVPHHSDLSGGIACAANLTAAADEYPGVPVSGTTTRHSAKVPTYALSPTALRICC